MRSKKGRGRRNSRQFARCLPGVAIQRRLRTRAAGGRRFVFDPPAALYDIRQQLGKPAPRFDLAFGVLRFKQGAAQGIAMFAAILYIPVEV